MSNVYIVVWLLGIRRLVQLSQRRGHGFRKRHSIVLVFNHLRCTFFSFTHETRLDLFRRALSRGMTAPSPILRWRSASSMSRRWHSQLVERTDQGVLSGCVTLRLFNITDFHQFSSDFKLNKTMSRTLKKKKHWSSKVVECVVSWGNLGDFGSVVEVLGGAEVGQFPYLGQMKLDILVCHVGKLPYYGDVLLEVNGTPVSGLTNRDTLAVIRHFREPIRLKTVKPGAFSSVSCALLCHSSSDCRTCAYYLT